MAPKSRPKSAPRITARSVNSLRVSPSGTNGRNSPGGAVELHGRSLKESLPGPNQIGCVRDYAAREASGEANLRWVAWNLGWKHWAVRSLDRPGLRPYCPAQYFHRSSTPFPNADSLEM